MIAVGLVLFLSGLCVIYIAIVAPECLPLRINGVQGTIVFALHLVPLGVLLLLLGLIRALRKYEPLEGGNGEQGEV
ncbi:MAG: hypothetical protein DRJ03_28490 [Chloroflexi bacterium]|nr:MAG: hypothetical protein DRJ03_28490 [Chloroflexota bacterium]